MQKSILILFLSILLNFSLYAQPEKKHQPPSGDEMAKNILNDLANKIQLSSSKKDSINKVLVAFFDDGKAYNKNGDKTIMEGLEKVRDEKIKKILTAPGDYNTYLKIIEDMKNRKPPQHRPEGGPGNGGRQGGPKNEGF